MNNGTKLLDEREKNYLDKIRKVARIEKEVPHRLACVDASENVFEVFEMNREERFDEKRIMEKLIEGIEDRDRIIERENDLREERTRERETRRHSQHKTTLFPLEGKSCIKI